MEWDLGGNQSVSVGNGLPQTKAAAKAIDLVTDLGAPHPEKLGSVSGNSPLSIAISNLTDVPPEKYSAAIVDSYALVAASALTRFEVPAGEIASSLLKDPKNFLAAVQNGERSCVTLETNFPMTASFGCLQIGGKRKGTISNLY